MDNKILNYFSELVGKSILPSLKNLSDSSSNKVAQAVKDSKFDSQGIEKALEVKESTNELIGALINTTNALLVKDRVDEMQRKVEETSQEIGELENKADELIKSIPDEQKLQSIIKPLIPAPIPGEPGKDYILTEKDKKEIAKSVKVPIVEKVVETVIEKQPIITNEIVEKAVADKPKEIVKKLESLEGDERLSVDAIKGIEKWKTNGTKLFGKAVKRLSELTDVNITSPSNNQSLTYDSASGKWVNETVSGGVSTFLDLTDTPNTYAGQALKVIQVNAGETAVEFTTLAGGGDALTANPLSQFAATTSLQLKGVMSDETGSGALVFANTPTLVTPEIGEATGTGVTLSGLTASEMVITNGSKKLVSAAVATYPSLTELTYVKGVTSALQGQIDGKQAADADLTTLSTAFASASASGPASLAFHEDTDNGTNKITVVGVASVTSDKVLTLPDATDTLVGKATTDTLTNKSIDLASNTLTGTKAQFDTAVSDGNIMFDGDSITNATANTHKVFYSDGSGVITELALGADGTFLKSNGAAVAPSFATPAGSGDVSKVGTPVNNQVGVWTGDGTLEGDAALTFDTATDVLSVGGTIELGHASDTTLSRASAGQLAVEGTNVLMNGGALGTPSSGTLTNCSGLPLSGVTDSTSEALGVGSLELGHASDTTITRVSAGVAAIEGVNILTVAGGTLTGNLTLGENTSIALDPAGSADGKYSGITVAATAGEALAFGDVIVLDVTAGKWFKGSVSAAAGADGDLRGGVGMCVLAAAGDASATTVLLNGTCRADANFPALTIGSVVYATTSGDITVTQPSTTDHIIKVLGYALTADEIYFNPSMDYMTHV